MSPFDRYNPTKPAGPVFQSEDKTEMQKVGEFLHRCGYHPHFSSSPVVPQQFEPRFIFRVLVPENEIRAASEVVMRYENGEFSI
jgi:hypothetical protein